MNGNLETGDRARSWGDEIESADSLSMLLGTLAAEAILQLPFTSIQLDSPTFGLHFPSSQTISSSPLQSFDRDESCSRRAWYLELKP